MVPHYYMWSRTQQTPVLQVYTDLIFYATPGGNEQNMLTNNTSSINNTYITPQHCVSRLPLPAIYFYVRTLYIPIQQTLPWWQSSYGRMEEFYKLATKYIYRWYLSTETCEQGGYSCSVHIFGCRTFPVRSHTCRESIFTNYYNLALWGKPDT